MVQNQDWTTLLESKPKFKELLEYTKSIKASNPRFCANSRWLGGGGLRSIRSFVALLSEGDLEIYKIASEVIYMALPDCKKCNCEIVGIPPKNSKRIYIKQLFEKLAEVSYWCSKHPSEADEIFESAQIIVNELMRLGIERIVVEATLYLGPVIDDEFINQFKEVYERRKT